jgi:hypothetical protein
MNIFLKSLIKTLKFWTFKKKKTEKKKGKKNAKEVQEAISHACLIQD